MTRNKGKLHTVIVLLAAVLCMTAFEFPALPEKRKLRSKHRECSYTPDKSPLFSMEISGDLSFWDSPNPLYF